MNKKLIVGFVIVLIAVLGVGVFLLLNSNKEKTEPIAKDGKALVVYFSVPETDDPDKKMTTEEENSAIVVGGKVLGNTQYVAMLIAENTGADIYRIEPKVPYTTNHTDLVAQARTEQNEDARPEIKDKVENFEEYDVIYVGYPIWWSDMPQILYTFFEQYNFDGKTVIPFSTHGGSGLAGTVNTIKNKLKGAKVETDAFTMSRNDMESAPKEVEKWLKDIGVIE